MPDGATNNSVDTIAAIATPTGSGGIGVVRVSGPKALEILKKVFIPHKKKSKPSPYLLRFGQIKSASGETLDEVLAVYMPGPKSFTGEDLLEIYCHAGAMVLGAIIETILSRDCRPAEAGEFSLRRFLNRGEDLTRLEGAADIVAAKTELSYRVSRQHLIGAYGELITKLRNNIINMLAELEADIDFPDEDDVGRIGQELLSEKLESVIAQLEELSESYRTGKIIKDGYQVLILGPPNAGKSLLFNRLVKRNRALVTPVPGTTRDYISEWIDIEGLPVELYDTAGIRRARGHVEKAGIASSQKLIKQANMIIYLFDINKRPSDFPAFNLSKIQRLIIVLNKIDLCDNINAKIQKWIKKLNITDNIFEISAKTGKGLRALTKIIYESAGISDLTDGLFVTSNRHKSKIDKCLTHLKEIEKSSAPVEVLSWELRQAADAIGEITGHIYTEQILDEIFSNFCIGK
ncbi:MAG: tRNA uridine-5-carboxymethylaminomethyl(34) synthesis GTPase MnmE [candidate division Zixibacteria bacterium]